jgi:hypothetical protein
MMQHQPQLHQNNHHQNGQRQHSSPRSSLHHTEPADSDDGGQALSGDDGENDYDDHQESTRHGKRKRPISVSYVHAPQLFIFPSPALSISANLTSHFYASAEERLLVLLDPLPSGPGLQLFLSLLFLDIALVVYVPVTLATGRILSR